MQAAEGLWVSPAQQVLQTVGKQMMIAEPLSALVEWDQKRMQRLHPAQHLPAVLTLANGVGELGAEALENRCAHQELPRILVELREHLIGEIRSDVAGVPREVSEHGLPRM